jgi:hypothetical protein
MQYPNTAKPATAGHGEPASKIELLGGGLNNQLNTEMPTDLQVRRLARRHALSLPLALVVAGLAYGGRP